jgi:hypothetical protein
MIASVPQSTISSWRENRSELRQPKFAPTSHVPERFVAVSLALSMAVMGINLIISLFGAPDACVLHCRCSDISMSPNTQSTLRLWACRHWRVWRASLIYGCLLPIWSIPALGQPTEHVTPCEQRSGAFWSEPFAVSRIRERHAVSLPTESTPVPPNRVRARICLRVGAHGEVLDVGGQCGDAALLAEAMGLVRSWRFEPPARETGDDTSIITHLTFQRHGDKADLIWDFKDYPVNEVDAVRLIRTLPTVAAQMKRNPEMRLEVDWYPEQRDGIFYLFHLYLYHAGAGMNFTSGWYDVNAYTGEVWDGLNFKPIRSAGLNRLRKAISQRVGFPKSIAAQYEGLEPWSTNADELIKNPCADRP